MILVHEIKGPSPDGLGPLIFSNYVFLFPPLYFPPPAYFSTKPSAPDTQIPFFTAESP